MAASTASAWLISPRLFVHSLSSVQASLRRMLAAPGPVGLDEAVAELAELLLHSRDVGRRVLAGRQPVLGHPDPTPQLVDLLVERVQRALELLDHRERPS